MKHFSKKRVVLFLLFIFPLFCFLLLTMGQNNFSKLPVITKNVIDISTIDSTKTFQKNVSIICFLGNEMDTNKGSFFNLNQKIYKPFSFKYINFQIVAIYPKGKNKEAQKLKKEIGAFTDMGQWKFMEATNDEIITLFNSLNTNDSLTNLFSNKAFLVDIHGDLRGRIADPTNKEEAIFGYNMQSVAELGNKMEDDVSVLYYEYYAAFKNKNSNKADREI